MVKTVVSLRLVEAAKTVGKTFPYYYPVCVRVRFKQNDEKIPAMGIDASLVIHYNEAFVKTLTDYELNAVVLHEIMHYMGAHHRRYMENPLKDSLPIAAHNIAMDIEINGFIANLPQDACRAGAFGFPHRKSYEEYLLLLKNKVKWAGITQGKMPADDLLLDGYDSASGEDGEDYANILNELKIECEKSEKNRGTERSSADTTRKIKKRKYRWEAVFQNTVTRKFTEATYGFRYRTFERAARRHAHLTDIVFPAFIDRKIKISLAIIMDISGSMYGITDKMYGIMKSMVNILDADIDITILEVNVCVENIISGFDLQREEVAGKEGGGTDMGAGLVYIQENKIKLDLIIVITDAYTPWPSPPILADKTVVLTNNPDVYNGPYNMYPVLFDTE